MMHWGVERQRLTPMAKQSNIPLHASCGMAMFLCTSGCIRSVIVPRLYDINKYEPIRVIEVDGQLVSYDNRRLLAAQNANLGSLTVDLLDKNDIAISKEGKQTTWWQRFQKRYADKRNIKAGGVVPDTGLSEKTIKASLIH